MHKPKLRIVAFSPAFVLGILIAAPSVAQPTHLPLPPPDMTAAPPKANQPPSGPATVAESPSADPTLHEREARVGVLIDQAVSDGSISPSQARKARGELTAIKQMEDRLRRRHHGEITETETFRLEGRIKALAATVRRGP